MVKKKTAKKRVSKSSKPVLTSPWKIGTLVSLLLVLVSLGVGGYFAYVYRIRLTWISIGPSGWNVDSYGFFREMYPLAAAVTIVSLVAYFAVVSAVRRYRCYLDSGQDYRKMISLAESIDDLTNPAQIARLSAFPELQGVLRNYGDQIREISQDIAREPESSGYEELESDVEALLREGSVPGTVLGSKPYAGAFRRIAERIAADRAKTDELAKRGDADRRALGRAALACGRAVETAGGAGEELMELAKAASGLDRLANELGSAAQAAGPSVRPQPGARKDGIAGIEGPARKLEDGKALLQEIADENNSVAIALALAAARSPAEGHELAALADRVRISAERFHKLGAVVGAVSKQLIESCRALRETEPAASAANPRSGLDERSSRLIVEMAGEIERRSANLRSLMCGLGGELHEAQELLRHDFAGQDASAPSVDVRPEDFVSEAKTPDGRESVPDASPFVIDHGSSWKGMPGADSEPAEEPATDMPEAANMNEAAEQESDTPSARPEDEPAADFSDMSSLRNLDGENAAEERAGEPATPPAAEDPTGKPGAAPGSDGAWMEMPGRRWLKVDVEKSEAEDSGAVDVKVEPPAPEPAPRRETGPEDGADDDPVHDLAELGAVEYVQEIEVER